MSNKLKSLEEHNSTSSTFYKGMVEQKPIPNGIACPDCGNELLDLRPNEILTSIPPKKLVGCSNAYCDFTNYRIA